MSETSKEWTDKQIQERFVEEIKQRFEAENVAYRAMEEDDIVSVKESNPAGVRRLINSGCDLAVQDSMFWYAYTHCEFTFPALNLVRVLLPDQVETAFLKMFDHTEMAWGRPHLGMTESITPGLYIEVLLVDSWSDARSTKHHEELKLLKPKTTWMDWMADVDDSVIGMFQAGYIHGLKDAVKKVKARQVHYELYREGKSDMMKAKPEVFSTLDEILVGLEAMVERGRYASGADLMALTEEVKLK